MFSKYAPVSYLYASKLLLDGTTYIVKPISVHMKGNTGLPLTNSALGAGPLLIAADAALPLMVDDGSF